MGYDTLTHDGTSAVSYSAHLLKDSAFACLSNFNISGYPINFNIIQIQAS